MNNLLAINRGSLYDLDNLKQSNAIKYLILFMIWPFMALLAALNNYTDKTAKRVVYIFVVYYGLSFVNTNVYVDAYHYFLMLQKTAQKPFSDFFNIVGGLYSDTNVDVMEPFVSFIISRFTTSGNIYFAVWTAFMGFFYLKSINLLYDRYQGQANWNTLILMVFFIFIAPITNISGIRMPTAIWIFFFAAYHVVLYRDKRYLLLALSACFVHWSFITANVLLIIYYFAGNRNFVYLPVAIASFVLPNYFAPVFASLSLMMGGAIENRYKGYANEEYVQDIHDSMESASWFLSLQAELLFYFLIFAVVVIQLWSRRQMDQQSDRNLYSFILLLISFVNFGKAVPTFGNRFQILLYLFMTLYVFIYFCKIEVKKIHWINLVGLFPMLLYASVQFRVGSESVNAWIFGPGFGVSLLLKSLSLSELLFN